MSDILPSSDVHQQPGEVGGVGGDRQPQSTLGRYISSAIGRHNERDLEAGTYEAPLKMRAIAGPSRARYDDVVETARFHEKRASFVVAERKKEKDQMEEIQQQLRKANEAMASMQQEKIVWQQQMTQRFQEESNRVIECRWQELQQQQHAQQHEMRNQIMAGQNEQQGDDDTEGQMVEQLLQFERQIEVLRDANERLEQEKSELQKGFERDLNHKVDEIISIRQRLHPAPVSAPAPQAPQQSSSQAVLPRASSQAPQEPPPPTAPPALPQSSSQAMLPGASTQTHETPQAVLPRASSQAPQEPHPPTAPPAPPQSSSQAMLPGASTQTHETPPPTAPQAPQQSSSQAMLPRASSQAPQEPPPTAPQAPQNSAPQAVLPRASPQQLQESFPQAPPQRPPQFVAPALRTARRLQATYKVLRNQGNSVPIVPLQPAATSAEVPATEAGSAVVPDPILTFNPHDPRSMETVQLIVEEVLKRLGKGGVTLSGTRGKTRANSRRAKETAIKLQQAIMKPEEDLLWKQAIREIWKKLFHVTEMNDFMTYVPADEEEVEAYNAGNGKGPGEDMQFDFSQGYTRSRWNVKILRQIYDLILATREMHNGWGLPDVSEGYLMGELGGQLKRSREAWALVQPRCLPEIRKMETSKQVAERVEAYWKKRRADVSGRSLRRRKFDKRVKTVEKVIHIKGSSNAVDMQTWEYFREILNKLSVGGMSSEEEGTEKIDNRTVSVYRVKLCLWRAVEIADYLRFIDKASEVPGMADSKGAKSVPRVKTDMAGQSGVPTGLPRKMYNPKWLDVEEKERPFYVQDELRVSEEAFELLVLATANL